MAPAAAEAARYRLFELRHSNIRGEVADDNQ